MNLSEWIISRRGGLLIVTVLLLFIIDYIPPSSVKILFGMNIWCQSLQFLANVIRLCINVPKEIQGSWVRHPVWPHTFVSPSADSRMAVVSYWRKYVH